MDFPVFTRPDPALVRAGAWRDPLGLQPVWSAFGRGLVPHLASPVRKVSGVKAVLVIHWLADTEVRAILEEDESRFRKYFRLMEGLLGYFLWQKGEHCYGAQSLGAGNFGVVANAPGTAVNGLYQYYRGSCRRAALLQDDWSTSAEIAEAIGRVWDKAATPPLQHALRTCLSNEKTPLVPGELLQGSPALKQTLEAAFASRKLEALLRKHLLDSPPFVEFARRCAMVFVGGNEVEPAVRLLHAWLQKTEGQARELLAPFERVLKCEPFLVALQDCFDYLRASPACKLDAITAGLAAAGPAIAARAADFRTLADAAPNGDRLREVVALAEAATKGLPMLLAELVDYHRRRMDERGKEPAVMIEAGTATVLLATERSVLDIRKRLVDGVPWENGYYFETAGNIYTQLFGVPHE